MLPAGQMLDIPDIKDVKAILLRDRLIENRRRLHFLCMFFFFCFETKIENVL